MTSLFGIITESIWVFLYMSHSPLHRVVIAADITKEHQQQLQTTFPHRTFEFRPIEKVEDIPAEIWQDTEILLVGSLAIPRPEQAPALRWVQLYLAGANLILQHPLYQSDVTFTTASGVHAINIGEYVLTTILAWYYRLPQLLAFQTKGLWTGAQEYTTLMPEELRGKTIGIIGYGSIGREVARLAQVFGMRVLAQQQSEDHRDHGFIFPGTGDAEGNIPERYYRPDELHELLRASDIVVLAVPLTNSTRYMINAETLGAMKSTAFLINIARGDVCDEEALIHALQEKRIAGAALDVFQQEPLPATSPLWHLPNVYLTPHVSGFTQAYETRVLSIFTENLRHYQSGRSLYNVIDKARGY
jgi:phosphoglycerate dehydrogenase-like enzyme